jgi:uncharacterized protein YjiS (DUF1127 family)
VILQRTLNGRYQNDSIERWLHGARRAGVARSISNSLARIRAARRTRRACDELATLDDRTLADIGLTRADVSYALPLAGRDSLRDNLAVLWSQSFTSL